MLSIDKTHIETRVVLNADSEVPTYEEGMCQLLLQRKMLL